MRHLQILAREEDIPRLKEFARSVNAISFWHTAAFSLSLEKQIVTVILTNRSVGSFLDHLSDVDEAELVLLTSSAIQLTPQNKNLQEQVPDLEPRSPVEIFLQSLQSVDQWSTFLIYALAGAIVVWIAFYTNSIFLLLAAMLIAPFAEPAMNVAVATAIGNLELFRKNILRYLAAIGITATVATLLAFLVNQNHLTELMVSISRISGVAFLLPLVAGLAGALNLIQPERTHLVSGSVAGVLIAASLAPPAGLLGMALSMNHWNIALSSAFLLALQLMGINLAGAAVLRIFGVRSTLQRYKPGKKSRYIALFSITFLLLIGLLFWQFSTPLQFERAGMGAQASQLVRVIIKESGIARTISIDARFPQPEPQGSKTLLVTGYIEPIEPLEYPDQFLNRYLQNIISKRLKQEFPELRALIHLVVIHPGGVDSSDQ